MPCILNQHSPTCMIPLPCRLWEKEFTSDAERVAFLFELYHKYTSLLPAPEKPKQRGEKTDLKRDDSYQCRDMSVPKKVFEGEL